MENPRLLERVKLKEFPPHSLAFFEPKFMFPERWKELEDAKMIKQFSALDVMDEGATDQYECRKCHERKCTYIEVQTRSADEPMTVFV